MHERDYEFAPCHAPPRVEQGRAVRLLNRAPGPRDETRSTSYRWQEHCGKKCDGGYDRDDPSNDAYETANQCILPNSFAKKSDADHEEQDGKDGISTARAANRHDNRRNCDQGKQCSNTELSHATILAKRPSERTPARATVSGRPGRVSWDFAPPGSLLPCRAAENRLTRIWPSFRPTRPIIANACKKCWRRPDWAAAGSAKN